MKNLLRITAIFNLLLVVLSFICVVIGVIYKNYDLLAPSIAFVLVSIFPAVMMLAICSDFNGGRQMKVIVKILGSIIGVILYPFFEILIWFVALVAVIFETMEKMAEEDI